MSWKNIPNDLECPGYVLEIDFQKRLATLKQVGLLPDYPYVHQLISAVDKMDNTFDANPSLEVRAFSFTCGTKVFYVKSNACV